MSNYYIKSIGLVERLDHRWPQWKLLALLFPALFTLLILFFYPLCRLLLYSFFDPEFTLKYYSRIFTSHVYLKVLFNTLKISFIVTIICLIIGYMFTYYLSQIAGKGVRNFAISIIMASFLISFLAKMFVFMIILQQKGVVNQTLIKWGIVSEPVKLLYNFPGVMIGMTQILLPFMILPLYSVMAGIDKNLLIAARGLGANPVKTFTKIFLPLSIPGISAGCIQVFILAIGYFIIPSLLGGPKEIMISQLIDLHVNRFGNWGFASALAVVLLIIVLVLFWIYNKYYGMQYMQESGGIGG